MINGYPTKQVVEQLRRQYPAGTRVELVRMEDVQAPPVGTLGTVKSVDDIGTVFVAWDTGSGLGVAYGEDEIRIAEQNYDVSFAVDGRLHVSVNARSFEEAKEKASEFVCEADFGELECIDWHAVNATDERGEMRDFV